MPEPLKNMFFTPAFLNDLAAATHNAHPAFAPDDFVTRVCDEQWESLELKGRMRQITLVLHDMLPADYPTALDILHRVFPALSNYGFDMMVFSDFVGLYGLDHWDISIAAFERFTQQMSAEYGVRSFINHDIGRMMAQMLAWTGHESFHVRRLSSEGCRPQLPWAIGVPALRADPTPILPILERLKCDEHEWVRRSVSNNLNDISKDHPDIVVEMAGRWLAEYPTPEMREIINHGLRTLLKRGHPGALALMGFGGDRAFTIKNLTVSPASIPSGGEVTFSFEVESSSDQPQNLMIDYIVYLKRANGGQSPKVFKLSKRVLAPGETITVTRRHSFKPVTTRRYYPGEHAIQIQINGLSSERCAFMVLGDET